MKTIERNIPSEMKDQFLMNGKVKLSYYVIDKQEERLPREWTTDEINKTLQKAQRKERFYYNKTDTWLYQALDKYSVKDMEVAIIGSQHPVYECICLTYGGKPTTIDYNEIICPDNRIKTITVEEYDKNPIVFDAIISISSMEHPGLGRYGDPVDPDGDLKEMKKMKSLVKKDGLFFQSVPVGVDYVTWNAHRIYGKIRLPLFLEGWELIDSFGVTDEDYKIDTGGAIIKQPIYVLRNSHE